MTAIASVVFSKGWLMWGLRITLGFIVALFLSSLAIVSYATGLGGYLSEKLIDSSGTSSSSILIEWSGVGLSDLDVVMGIAATPLSATNVIMDGTGTHATLRANVTDLHGFPSASVWFEWGTDISFGGSTPAQTVLATGIVAATIDHYDPNQTIYYRLDAQPLGFQEGVTYSSPAHFALSSSAASSSSTTFSFL